MRSRLLSFLKEAIPNRESLAKYRLLRRFAPHFVSRELWRLTRRSVPRGVAIGIFAGLVVLVPGFQIVVAVMLCMLIRANIPAAAAATFVNTPVTTPPLVYACYLVGQWIMGGSRAGGDGGGPEQELTIGQWIDWLVYDAGPPFLLGLAVVTVVCTSLGYFLASGLWGLWVRRKRLRKIHARRKTEHPSP